MEDRFLQQLKKGVLEMLVLETVCEAPTYGYELLTKLKTRSNGLFALKEGTLYPILHTLEADRLVTVREKEAETGRMRKYYRITRKGLKVLEEKKEEWTVFTEKVNAVVCSPV